VVSSHCVRTSAWVLIGVACVAVVAVYGELSAQALIAVTATGVVLSVVALARRAGEAAGSVGRAARPWSVWLLAALMWELATLGSDRLSTLSDLTDPVLAHPVPRAAATVGWLAVGAWLLARPVHRDGAR
jgi:hypothetical protein